MKIQIIKRKAASLRELGREIAEIEKVSSLRELLTELTRYELGKQGMNREASVLQETDIQNQSKLGRVAFGISYNENKPDMDKAIETMVQDFEDGLFRVFINEKEYTELDGSVQITDGAEVALVRLVMLAGRMW